MKNILILLFLLLAIKDTQCFESADQRPYRIQLEKREISTQLKNNYKQLQQTLSSSSQKAEDPDDIGSAIYDLKLRTQFGMSYFGTVQVGSPGKNLSALFDSGSSFIWFTSDECETCQKSGIKEHFSCAQSQTCESLNKSIKMVYGVGQVKGGLSTDVFKIAELTTDNQVFVIATHIEQLQQYPADGLVGLGFSTLSKGYSTLLENLYSQKKIPNKLFCLYLANPIIGQLQSSIDIGAIDKQMYTGDTINYLPVVSKYYWAVELSDIFFTDNFGDRVDLRDAVKNPKKFCNKAIIDSGTSVIAMGRNELNGVLKLLNYNGFRCLLSKKYSQILCKGYTHARDYPQLNIRLGQQDYALPNEQYVICEPGAFCVVRITPLNLKSYIILGDIFIQQYYTIFDEGNHQIGFAPKNEQLSQASLHLNLSQKGSNLEASMIMQILSIVLILIVSTAF